MCGDDFRMLARGSRLKPPTAGPYSICALLFVGPAKLSIGSRTVADSPICERCTHGYDFLCGPQ